MKLLDMLIERRNCWEKGQGKQLLYGRFVLNLCFYLVCSFLFIGYSYFKGKENRKQKRVQKVIIRKIEMLLERHRPIWRLILAKDQTLQRRHQSVSRRLILKKQKEKQLCIQNKRLYTESAFPGLWYCRKQKYRRIDSLS